MEFADSFSIWKKSNTKLAKKTKLMLMMTANNPNVKSTSGRDRSLMIGRIKMLTKAINIPILAKFSQENRKVISLKKWATMTMPVAQMAE